MQEARTARSNIAVVFNPYVAEPGVPPFIVTMTPVRRPGDNVAEIQSFDFLANTLRRKILERLRPSRPGWSDARFRRQVNGSLMMQNVSVNTSNTFTADVPLNEINAETFMDHFQRPTANGSTPIIELWQVEWSYWINPASIQV